MKRLILFSGMGGDARLMRPVRVPGVEQLTPEHVEPRAGESLADYARRVAEMHGIRPQDIVGGASFGGMIAAEIARQREVAGLVLLGSCTRPDRLPASYRFVEKLQPLIPDQLLALRTLRLLVRARFAPTTPEAMDTLIAMAKDCPASQLRGFAAMTFGWEGAERFECPVLALHGDRDAIIPIAAAREGHIVLKNAGHSFTLTHADETSAHIARFVSEL
jgi:pimeloyl-ACP methyl ester carboxylesterase